MPPKWPADHEEKHREAALKGWEGRTRSPFRRRRESRQETAVAERRPTHTARLSVRPHRYHDQDGFLISGRDAYNRGVKIFSRSRAEAERMRGELKAGQEPTFDYQRQQAS